MESNGDKPEGGWTGVSWGDRTHELRYASLNEGIRSIISFCCESVRIEINKTPYPLTLLTVCSILLWCFFLMLQSQRIMLRSRHAGRQVVCWIWRIYRANWIRLKIT